MLPIWRGRVSSRRVVHHAALQARLVGGRRSRGISRKTLAGTRVTLQRASDARRIRCLQNAPGFLEPFAGREPYALSDRSPSAAEQRASAGAHEPANRAFPCTLARTYAIQRATRRASQCGSPSACG